MDHRSDPLCVKTVCDIYASLVKGTEFEGKSFKKKNVVVTDVDSDHMYVTASVVAEVAGLAAVAPAQGILSDLC